MGNGWTLALLLHIPFICGAAVETNWTVTAKRGKFFVQRLESPWNQSESGLQAVA